jgi:hypothetical protein
MRGLSPSRRLPSWPRSNETVSCANGTRYIRSMSWRNTKAMPRPSISPHYVLMSPLLTTVTHLRRFENLHAGPPEPARRRYRSPDAVTWDAEIKIILRANFLEEVAVAPRIRSQFDADAAGCNSCNSDRPLCAQVFPLEITWLGRYSRGLFRHRMVARGATSSPLVG